MPQPVNQTFNDCLINKTSEGALANAALAAVRAHTTNDRLESLIRARNSCRRNGPYRLVPRNTAQSHRGRIRRVLRERAGGRMCDGIRQCAALRVEGRYEAEV